MLIFVAQAPRLWPLTLKPKIQIKSHRRGRLCHLFLLLAQASQSR
jgi:hypothetical protein